MQTIFGCVLLRIKPITASIRRNRTKSIPLSKIVADMPTTKSTHSQLVTRSHETLNYPHKLPERRYFRVLFSTVVRSR